jgi:hypothetical protein
MKITFIGHASILIEAGPLRILSDPWWRGPCFGAQWWHYPEPDLEAVREAPIDFIYVSHGHEDHLHAGTLKTFDRSTRILVSTQTQLSPGLRALGFEVLEVAPEHPLTLADGIAVWIWPTHGGDTLLVLKQGDEVCVNLNDALHAAPEDVQDRFITRLNSSFPNPDYVFCGYGIASHFPNCYRVPGKNDRLTAANRQSYFNGQWARIMHGLRPRFGFPFAASVVFFEPELIELNETVHNSERPTDRYRAQYGELIGELIDIRPGFQIADGVVTKPLRFEPLDIGLAVKRNAEALLRATTYSAPTDALVSEIAELLRSNIALCERYLREYRGDYEFLIAFRGSDKGIRIVKRASRIEVISCCRDADPGADCDLIYRTRAVYLRRSLQEPYADEVLFVGSGGIFEYRSRRKAADNLHRDLQVMMRRHDACPASRYGDNPYWLYALKQGVKWLLGRRERGLYDLKTWAVYDN